MHDEPEPGNQHRGRPGVVRVAGATSAPARRFCKRRQVQPMRSQQHRQRLKAARTGKLVDGCPDLGLVDQLDGACSPRGLRVDVRVVDLDVLNVD